SRRSPRRPRRRARTGRRLPQSAPPVPPYIGFRLMAVPHRVPDAPPAGSGRRSGTRYVELHAHSAYSFLDGASLPEELAVRAGELAYEALALTDHDGVYGSLEFAHAAKAFGVRSITGAEVTLADESHVTLLVESPRGYANLCRLLTAAHKDTRPPGRETEPV